MNYWLVEAFERKLLKIIDDTGVNGDGTVTINAEELLLMIRLYKHQTATIESLKTTSTLEDDLSWQIKYDVALKECNKAVEDYNEIWRIYTQILHDGITMKRKMNKLSAQNEIMLETITAIANARVDDVDDIIKYAGALLETFNNNS